MYRDPQTVGIDSKGFWMGLGECLANHKRPPYERRHSLMIEQFSERLIRSFKVDQLYPDEVLRRLQWHFGTTSITFRQIYYIDDLLLKRRVALLYPEYKYQSTPEKKSKEEQLQFTESVFYYKALHQKQRDQNSYANGYLQPALSFHDYEQKLRGEHRQLQYIKHFAQQLLGTLDNPHMQMEYIYSEIKEHFKIEVLSQTQLSIINRVIEKRVMLIKEGKRDRNLSAKCQAFAAYQSILGKRGYKEAQRR